MKRKASIFSRVGPAVTTTLTPWRGPSRLGVSRSSFTRFTICWGSANLPRPVSPQASAPASPMIIDAPRLRSLPMFSWVAGWRNMWLFMAGAKRILWGKAK